MKNFFRKILLFMICFGMISTTLPAQAGKKGNPPLKKIDALIIGERVLDIAYNLGYAPRAIVARYSLWDMGSKFEPVSARLGCPVKVCKKAPETVPKALEKMKIKRIIIEKSPEYCIYKNITPECVLKHIKNQKDLIIEYVDFSKGLESAVQQTSKLLGCNEKADKIMAKYQKNMAVAQKNLAKVTPGKKVVLLSGTFQRDTGKTFLRVEAAGGYSDKYMLGPLKAANVGDSLKTGSAKNNKGHFSIRSLKGLAKVNPDIIVLLGDAAAVQKALSKATQKNPKLANVTALKNNAVYALPFYADCGVLEYPVKLNKWACIFK
jgi:Periplasmic binding protein